MAAAQCPGARGSHHSGGSTSISLLPPYEGAGPSHAHGRDVRRTTSAQFCPADVEGLSSQMGGMHLYDPWLYNEYTDGRKIPAVYENFQAGKDLGGWLLGK